MFKDYFLKFASEAEAIEKLTAEQAVNEDGEIITSSADFAIDPVGVIYKPTGKTVTSEDGFEYPEMAPLDGWHLNVRMINGDLPESLIPYSVSPDSPMRVFG